MAADQVGFPRDHPAYVDWLAPLLPLLLIGLVIWWATRPLPSLHCRSYGNGGEVCERIQ